MSIQSEVERISSAKNNIINSIKSKGVDVPLGTSISNLSSYIDQIKLGNSYFSEAFPINNENWIQNTSSNNEFDKYMNENSINYSGDKNLSIVSISQISYDTESDSFVVEELNAFYSWNYIDIIDNNKIVLYSKEKIDNNFGIIVTFSEN